VNDGRFTVTLREIEEQDPSYPSPPWHPVDEFEAYFDASIVSALSARYVLPGDRIEPLGLGGSRKVQDVLVDRKMKLASRGCWPLIIAGNRVVWIPGVVRSGAALVSEQSRKIWHLRAEPLSNEVKFGLPET
jgi:tRNA(Ile)-lysidine synthetase-like protein